MRINSITDIILSLVTAATAIVNLIYENFSLDVEGELLASYKTEDQAIIFKIFSEIVLYNDTTVGDHIWQTTPK